MKRTISVFLILICIPVPVFADGSKDGLDAYNRGDYATAFEKWKPLAEQGNVEAQSALGSMYNNGQGVPQDYKEAIKWYQLAVRQGYAGAQFNLGVLYRDGMGVIQDYVQANKWFNIAKENGNADARKGKELLEKVMPGFQIAEAQKLAKEWMENRSNSRGITKERVGANGIIEFISASTLSETLLIILTILIVSAVFLFLYWSGKNFNAYKYATGISKVMLASYLAIELKYSELLREEKYLQAIILRPTVDLETAKNIIEERKEHLNDPSKLRFWMVVLKVIEDEFTTNNDIAALCKTTKLGTVPDYYKQFKKAVTAHIPTDI